MARAMLWDEVLIALARRYPAWEAVDLYKLAHQATRGSEHAAPSEPTAREWMERELQEMGAGPVEPLVDPIRADGTIARVHLRPWKEAGLDPEALVVAFLETAAGWQVIPGELEEALRQSAAFAVKLGLAAGEVAALAARMQGEGYPAAHHSEAYRTLYRPAYRVVAMRYLPRDLGAGFLSSVGSG